MADAEYKRLQIGASLINPVKSSCGVAGCNRQKAARGWCKTHWAKWKKYGDPSHGDDKPKMKPFCEIVGCGRAARSRWQMGVSVCAMHYLRRMQTGSFDEPRVVQSADGICVELGCGNAIRSVHAKHCERHYYQLRRTGAISKRIVEGELVVAEIPEYRECQYCGKALTETGKKHCSPRCATRASRGVAAKTKCKHCNTEFEPFNGAVCCSKKCFSDYKRSWHRSFYKARVENDPVFRAKVRHAEYKRKALKKNAFVEHVDRNLVMQRDGWMCHICGENIPKDAKWPSGLFGTLDHVHPLIRGGAHSYRNVKAAHLSCNCKKGAKVAWIEFLDNQKE